MFSIQTGADVFVPHIGWLKYPADDIVLRHLREGNFEFREQAFLCSFLREADTFVDAGAHCGLFSRLASNVIDQRGSIFAIEPNPDVLPYLRDNTDDSLVEICIFALSNSIGEAVLWQGNSA